MLGGRKDFKKNGQGRLQLKCDVCKKTWMDDSQQRKTLLERWDLSKGMWIDRERVLIANKIEVKGSEE